MNRRLLERDERTLLLSLLHRSNAKDLSLRTQDLMVTDFHLSRCPLPFLSSDECLHFYILLPFQKEDEDEDEEEQ